MSSGSLSPVVQRSIDQTGRILKITCAAFAEALPSGSNVEADKAFGLEVLTGTEEVSKPFEFRLRLLSFEQNIDCTKLLKKPATVSILLPGDDPTAEEEYRYINGIFSRFAALQTTSQDFFIYEATLVPNLWLLSLTRNCKIFQNKSIPTIVGEVLGESITHEFETQGTYSARDYVVQYRESALDFISRLLEDEGIYYYFVHTSTQHTLKFADLSTAASDLANAPTEGFKYSGSEKNGPSGGGIYSLTRSFEPCSNKVSLKDYDFTDPNSLPSAETTNALTYSSGEFFDYPGNDMSPVGTASASGDGSETNPVDRYATTRMEEFETFTSLIEGQSEYAQFCCGYKFTLAGHPATGVDGDYFLVSVGHDATDTTFRTSENKSGSYSNRYRAIPKATKYRPPRITPKPVLNGPQTAVVVGPSGDEIYTDQYGRVKVQFFWDRIGTKDASSSCWMRVSQIWAGKNWGWITIPRVGQEVIVSFLEGDPDRPIITGRVYNADQTVPYALPDNKTQSGIRSRSSLQGGTSDYNELLFEDKKDNEKITFHAQKDMLTEVEHDDTQTVDNDRTITVKGKHTETITKDTSIKITEGNHTLDVQTGNHSITVDQGNHSMTVSVGNHSVTVDTGNQSINVNTGSQSTTVTQSISITSMESITLTVEDSSIEITPTNINLSAPMINISAEGIAAFSGAVVQIEGDITLIN